MSYRPIKDPETSRVWLKEAYNLAASYAPTIFPCQACGHPVAEGYCCGTCGSDDPGSADDTEVHLDMF